MEAILSSLAKHRHARASARGVTLIELMVVIVVVAILATVAIPSYRRYLLRSQRSEAKIALLNLQAAQEKHYLQNNMYTSNLTAASPTGLGILNVTETGKYTIEVATAVGGQSYTATAKPATGGGQADDKDCTTFTLTDRGVRGATGTGDVQKCWK